MSDVRVEINLNALVRALVKNSHVVRGQADRHTGFQNLIAKSQGFKDYRSMMSCLNVEPKEKTTSIIEGTCFDYDASTVVALRLCKIDANTRKVVFIEKPEVFFTHSVLEFDGGCSALVGQYGKDQYALGTLEDYKKATAVQTAMAEAARNYYFEGHFVNEGLNGDYEERLKEVFENFQEDHSIGMNDALADTVIWSPESEEDHLVYEFYINSLQWLHATVNPKDKLISVEDEEGELTIECIGN